MNISKWIFLPLEARQPAQGFLHVEGPDFHRAGYLGMILLQLEPPQKPLMNCGFRFGVQSDLEGWTHGEVGAASGQASPPEARAGSAHSEGGLQGSRPPSVWVFSSERASLGSPTPERRR